MALVRNTMNSLIPPEFPPQSYRDVYRLALRINRKWYNRGGTSEFDPMAEPWDNLLILDAARPEYLDETTERECGSVAMPSSSSGDFMEAVWNGRTFHDTVYVTTNPHAGTTLDDGVFHAVYSLLETDWDSETETVPPERVVKRAADIHEQHPDKRLIVHFMQPHYPFLGETGSEIDTSIAQSLGESSKPNPWNEAMWGDIDTDALVEAYRENHEIAMHAAEKLVEQLAGRTVITADHANLIGERGTPIPVRQYGHPINFQHPKVTRVPWIKIDGERRTVTADPPQSAVDIEDDVVSDRLEALGYA